MSCPVQSQLTRFYQQTTEERLDKISQMITLSPEERQILTRSLDLQLADKLIENVIGIFSLPMGIATNFLIDGKDVLVPMVTEEASVIAAASFGAKLARDNTGFHTTASEAFLLAQIQLLPPSHQSYTFDWDVAERQILAHKADLLKLANEKSPSLSKYGGGAVDFELRRLQTLRGSQLIFELKVLVGEAMGANAATVMAEELAPQLESLTGARTLLRILSNLSLRLFKAEAVWSKKQLAAAASRHRPDGNLMSEEELNRKGEELVESFLDAWAFAEADPFRAATNNKGIMNGIDALALATGNDCRALESGVHAYAALQGRYTSLSRYEKTEEGDLRGILELPLAIGTVGGATRALPSASLALKLLGSPSSSDLGRVMASVGLAQNFAAIRALVTEGLVKGHMRLHAKNLAVSAGATGELVDWIAFQMINENNVSSSRAKQLLSQYNCHVL